jgi:hypothetical protein
MTATDMVIAFGRATREAARGAEPSSDFSRGQLMSVFSATRHLAVELSEFPPELRSFTEVVAPDLRAAGELAGVEQLVSLGTELAASTDAQQIGDLLSAALEQLRGDQSASAVALRARVHGALRRLSDREVELLADAIEGPAG